MGSTDTALLDDMRLKIASGFRLQWETVQNSYVLLFPEGMVKLNGSAGEILRRCNDTQTLSELVVELEQTFGRANLREEIHAFIAMAIARGWVEASS
jgi:pyrroloquinoline quinone biosynthesis protein D